MQGALIDTGVLLDYLRGDKRAQRALASSPQRAISVVSWLAVMRECPAHLLEATEGFLRTFERLSISESIADEALRLISQKPDLPEAFALTLACARVNQMVLITAENKHVQRKDAGVLLPYKRY
jgi:predicted nucleic acid-binding protein